jgi:hypothetical protein
VLSSGGIVVERGDERWISGEISEGLEACSEAYSQGHCFTLLDYIWGVVREVLVYIVRVVVEDTARRKKLPHVVRVDKPSNP